MPKVEHYCVKCRVLIGAYEPLTDTEREQGNVLQVCLSCYYGLYPYKRPDPWLGEWVRKTHARNHDAE